MVTQRFIYLTNCTVCRPWAGQCPGSLRPRASKKDRAEAETSPRTTLRVGAVIEVTVVGTWSEETPLWEEGIGADAWTLKRKQPLREERPRWREQLQRPEAGTNGPVRGKEKHVCLARRQGWGRWELRWQRSAEDRSRGALQEGAESLALDRAGV